MNTNKSLARIGTYLDNGFWIVSGQRAGRLCKPYNGLPRHGYEKRITFEGADYWVARTVHQGKLHWTIREAR
jgi:hypothetical protein